MIRYSDFPENGIQVSITIDAEDFFFLRSVDTRGTGDTGIIEHILEQVKDKIQLKKKESE